MTLERIGVPALEPVSLQDMKSHLRLEHDEEDALLNEMIIAARMFLENRLSLAFITARWRFRPRNALTNSALTDRALTSRGFAEGGRGRTNAYIKMPLFPIHEVDNIKLFLADGTTVFADLAHMKIETSSRPATLSHIPIPLSVQPEHGLEIEFMAGYGALAEDVPAPLRLAIKMLAASFYENRIDAGDCQSVSMPASVSMLLMDYMEVRLR